MRLHVERHAPETREFVISSDDGFVTPLDQLLGAVGIAALGHQLLRGLGEPPPLIGVIAAIVGVAVGVSGWAVWKLGTVRRESVLVARGLGIHMRVETFLGRTSTRFVEASRITVCGSEFAIVPQDVLIAEGFRAQDVVYYMAFEAKCVGKEEKEMILAFRYFYPPLETLLVVYRGARGLLLGEGEKES